MTITAARKKFDKLSTAILTDGKVDWNETEVLLDFIDPYVRAGNKTFTNFRILLLKYREDGVITEEESREIMNAIKSVSAFLKNEQFVEWLFFSIFGVFVLGIIASVIIH